MAHFAKLDSNNIVESVIVVSNDDSGGGDLDNEATGITFCRNHVGDNSTNWKQTSYNGNFRGNYAGIGMIYMTGQATLGVGSTDIFIRQKPYPSWTLGVNRAQWCPPVNPGDPPALTNAEIATGKYYVWNETNYNSNPATAWVLT
jgi:hypothetical protein